MVRCLDCTYMLLMNETYFCNRHKSPVTGEPAPRLAEMVRNDNSQCGLDGRWFVPPVIQPPPLPLAS